MLPLAAILTFVTAPIWLWIKRALKSNHTAIPDLQNGAIWPCMVYLLLLVPPCGQGGYERDQLVNGTDKLDKHLARTCSRTKVPNTGSLWPWMRGVV